MRIVVKIGSNCIVPYDKPDFERVKKIVNSVISVMKKDNEVVIVSSGAIACGRYYLGWQRTSKIEEKQACAAVGQNILMDMYYRAFSQKHITPAQILLVESDFDDREHYINAKKTIDVLLKKKIVPIINENDTVSTSEIVFGDNDVLSALITDLVDAELLVILTNVEGLMDEKGNIIREVENVKDVIHFINKNKSSSGRGGMFTKLKAMEIVTFAGKTGIIAPFAADDVLNRILSKERIGTLFKPKKVQTVAKKRWLAFGTKCRGRVVIDEGAVKALYQNKSLLAGGVTSVEGAFPSLSVVEIVSKDGSVIGKGIVSFSSTDLNKIKGHKSSEFEKILGRKTPAEIIHKDNLFLR